MVKLFSSIIFLLDSLISLFLNSCFIKIHKQCLILISQFVISVIIEGFSFFL